MTVAIIVVSILAVLTAVLLAVIINKEPTGTPKMQSVAAAISKGARVFLYQEYKILGLFVLVVFMLLFFFLDNPTTNINEGIYLSGSFLLGALFSCLSGFVGMSVATKANVRTTQAARDSLGKALSVAFRSGSVMGLIVVGLGLGGLAGLYMILPTFGLLSGDIITVIIGFGLGASFVALFSRVGGGIYTKAADVAADLVGKIEAKIPEDDPRNPAVIADNVGDNVGDVAGMGADLFESYVGSLIASMVIGYVAFDGSVAGVFFPLFVAAIGIISSIIGMLFVRSPPIKKKQTESQLDLYSKQAQKSLKRGMIVASVVTLIAVYFLASIYLPRTFTLGGVEYSYLGPFFAILVGLLAGVGIGMSTEYYTSERYKPVKELSEMSKKGSASVILGGLSLGFMSTAIPIFIIAVNIFIAYYVGGLYGIALSAVGMLSTLGISLAIDAFGPVVDNAGGIAEMSHLPKHVRERTDVLDATGNTTAAIGKGFAIGSAALAALSLFSSYSIATGLQAINILTPDVVIGMFIGGCLPFLFSALTIDPVNKVAAKIIVEIRRQFKQMKGILTGKQKPDYDACIALATKNALIGMIIPGLLALLSPVVVGLLFGAAALGGMLAASLISGVLLALFMANAGGAWDNAKKYIEQGHHGGKGSKAHHAAVVGDTVGDPCKDTSGPSLNILIKLMSIVSLVCAPLIVKFGGILF